MKKARGEIFAEQESKRRGTLEERQATINTARATAQSALQEAKKSIAADVQEARAELELSKDNLANEIAEAILAGRPSGPGDSKGRGGAMKNLRGFLAFASGAFLIFFFTALPALAAEGAEPDPADSSRGFDFSLA